MLLLQTIRSLSQNMPIEQILIGRAVSHRGALRRERCCPPSNHSPHLSPRMPSTIPAPVPIDEPVPNDLICSICMSIPSDVPVITPCHHLFCKDCLQEALSIKELCPVDRCKVRATQVKDLHEGTLPWRLWANTRVKCANHDNGCLWTGGIADFRSHAEMCGRKHNNQNQDSIVLEELRQYKQLNVTLQDTIRKQDDEIAALRMQLEENRAGADIESLGLFDGSYIYDREDIIRLSQLICIGLEQKPDFIDSNKIFNAVQARFKDWEMGYDDNPTYYDTDMKMLIGEWLSFVQKASADK